MKGNLRWAICIACLSEFVGAASAQDAAPDADIRRRAQQILAEPEFRYFEHLDEFPDRPDGRGRRQRISTGAGDRMQSESSESTDRPGGERDGNGSRKDGSGRPRRSDKERPSPTASPESESGLSGSSVWSPISGAVGVLFHALAYLVLAAVCLLIVYLVVQAIVNREATADAMAAPLSNLDLPQDEDHPPGELPADSYLAKAHDLAQKGKYREAMAQLLLGGMSSIERAELIRHRRGLTLRDYLRSLRGQAPRYDGFKTMIRLYEPIAFGRRVASYQTFHDALIGYQMAVEGRTP